MRVLGNSRIEKANFCIAAYQRAPAFFAAPILDKSATKSFGMKEK
jgi:hypothetical protein